MTKKNFRLPAINFLGKYIISLSMFNESWIWKISCMGMFFFLWCLVYEGLGYIRFVSLISQFYRINIGDPEWGIVISHKGIKNKNSFDL